MPDHVLVLSSTAAGVALDMAQENNWNFPKYFRSSTVNINSSFDDFDFFLFFRNCISISFKNLGLKCAFLTLFLIMPACEVLNWAYNYDCLIISLTL